MYCWYHSSSCNIYVSCYEQENMHKAVNHLAIQTNLFVLYMGNTYVVTRMIKGYAPYFCNKLAFYFYFSTHILRDTTATMVFVGIFLISYQYIWALLSLISSLSSLLLYYHHYRKTSSCNSMPKVMIQLLFFGEKIWYYGYHNSLYQKFSW